jgi:hypothetical protein
MNACLLAMLKLRKRWDVILFMQILLWYNFCIGTWSLMLYLNCNEPVNNNKIFYVKNDVFC